MVETSQKRSLYSKFQNTTNHWQNSGKKRYRERGAGERGGDGEIGKRVLKIV